MQFTNLSFTWHRQIMTHGITHFQNGMEYIWHLLNFDKIVQNVNCETILNFESN